MWHRYLASFNSRYDKCCVIFNINCSTGCSNSNYQSFDIIWLDEVRWKRATGQNICSQTEINQSSRKVAWEHMLHTRPHFLLHFAIIKTSTTIIWSLRHLDITSGEWYECWSLLKFLSVEDWNRNGILLKRYNPWCERSCFLHSSWFTYGTTRQKVFEYCANQNSQDVTCCDGWVDVKHCYFYF